MTRQEEEDSLKREDLNLVMPSREEETVQVVCLFSS